MIELLLTFAISLIWALVVALQSYLHSQERKAHRQECRELANRIQHPQLLPTDQPTVHMDVVTEPDLEWGRVGTIELGDNGDS
jgi:hypothetical protein